LVVDTYGIPTYLEANPTVITIVTFPFFFGMMFGDMGHGSIIMLFGMILMLFNDKLKDGAFKSVLPVRYLLFLMGFMATYCGFIYNEFFAIPIIKFMTEVIAGLFILLGLFGWMDALIISKFFKIPNLDECSPTYEPLGENKN